MEAKRRAACPTCSCSDSDSCHHQRQTSKVFAREQGCSSSASSSVRQTAREHARICRPCSREVWSLGVDGCGVGACSRSDLRRSVTFSQIRVSYACRKSDGIFHTQICEITLHTPNTRLWTATHSRDAVAAKARRMRSEPAPSRSRATYMCTCRVHVCCRQE